MDTNFVMRVFSETNSVGSGWADFEPFNFSYGYRTYNSAYPFSAIAETCP